MVLRTQDIRNKKLSISPHTGDSFNTNRKTRVVSASDVTFTWRRDINDKDLKSTRPCVYVMAWPTFTYLIGNIVKVTWHIYAGMQGSVKNARLTTSHTQWVSIKTAKEFKILFDKPYILRVDSPVFKNNRAITVEAYLIKKLVEMSEENQDTFNLVNRDRPSAKSFKGLKPAYSSKAEQVADLVMKEIRKELMPLITRTQKNVTEVPLKGYYDGVVENKSAVQIPDEVDMLDNKSKKGAISAQEFIEHLNRILSPMPFEYIDELRQKANKSLQQKRTPKLFVWDTERPHVPYTSSIATNSAGYQALNIQEGEFTLYCKTHADRERLFTLANGIIAQLNLIIKSKQAQELKKAIFIARELEVTPRFTEEGEGWVLQAGSQIAAKEDGVLSDSYRTLRNELNVDSKGVLLSETVFTSPSAVASMIYGSQTNGKLTLKLKDSNVTLKEWKKRIEPVPLLK